MQDEEFEPQMGRAGYINNGVEGEMEVGRTYFMKRGDVHTFWNAEPDKPMELKVKVSMTPFCYKSGTNKEHYQAMQDCRHPEPSP